MTSGAVSVDAQGPRLVTLTQDPSATVRLYGLPPGGRGPEAFLPWCPLLPPAVELCAVHLPGRGELAGQPCITDPHALTTTLADLIHAHNDSRPFAFFGHSLGALLGFAIARRLQRLNRTPPVLLAVSGLPAPHLGAYTGIGNKLVVAGHSTVAETMGLPASGEPDASYVPQLGDLLLMLQYRHRDERPLDCDFAIYGGRNDPVSPVDQLAAWSDLATTPVAPRLFPGGHDYLVEQLEPLISQLCRDLHAATGPMTS